MSRLPVTLLCFAVPEESKYYDARSNPSIRTLVTGMGRRNVEKSLQAFLDADKPGLILSCGFAGGLDPELATGDVIYAVEGNPELKKALSEAGARPGSFHCSQRILITAAEKSAASAETRADAVDMESAVIAGMCRQHGVSSGVVRVILDTAREDLALDFNQVLTPNQHIDFGRLMMSLLRSPGKIPGLWRLRAQTTRAARNLAQVLDRIT